MVLRLLFFFLVFCGMGKTITQASTITFVELWQEMLSYDDNEKNFRFAPFLESINQLTVDLKEHEIQDFLPDDWSYKVSSDSTVVTLAGILPYRYVNSRLIYLIKYNDDKFRLSHKEIETIPDVQNDISIEYTVIERVESEKIGGVKIFNLGREVEHVADVEVKVLFHKLVTSSDDAHKELLSENIQNRLKYILSAQELLANDFSGFDRMSTLISDDKKVKICTWNIAYFNGDNAFYGLVAVVSDGNIDVFELFDRHRHIETPERQVLAANQWFGAVYYDVIEQTREGKKIYTLLGYNAHNAFTKIRVIDVLSINAQGEPVFGQPVFMKGRELKNRMIFEYSIRANMMLRYDRNERMIVMDNLASFDPFYADDPRYMGPDFSHNGLRFENGRWLFYDEIDLRNRQPRRRRN